MFRSLALFCVFALVCAASHALTEQEIKKTQLEDIFIWKISDELKLTVQQEKAFTELSKSLNRKKSEINRLIQESIQSLEIGNKETNLQKYRRLMSDYNQLSLKEFDSFKKLLGVQKYTEYIRIKNELNTKVKSILIGEKPVERKEPLVKLPPPKIIVEK